MLLETLGALGPSHDQGVCVGGFIICGTTEGKRVKEKAPQSGNVYRHRENRVEWLLQWDLRRRRQQPPSGGLRDWPTLPMPTYALPCSEVAWRSPTNLMPSRARRFIILSRSGSRENQKNQSREIFLLRIDDPFALQFSERTIVLFYIWDSSIWF